MVLVQQTWSMKLSTKIYAGIHVYFHWFHIEHPSIRYVHPTEKHFIGAPRYDLQLPQASFVRIHCNKEAVWAIPAGRKYPPGEGGRRIVASTALRMNEARCCICYRLYARKIFPRIASDHMQIISDKLLCAHCYSPFAHCQCHFAHCQSPFAHSKDQIGGHQIFPVIWYEALFLCHNGRIFIFQKTVCKW